MGGWHGGQAEYVMVPYADWNALRYEDRDQAMEKILDLFNLAQRPQVCQFQCQHGVRVL